MDDKFLDMLNRAVAREVKVSIQYMWQHVMAKGINSLSVKNTLRSIAIVEMQHAEEIAKRLNDLGGIPTTEYGEVNIGKDIAEMLEIDVKEEEEAINLYKEIISRSEEISDIGTRTLFEKILADEENHYYTFKNLLE
jgi:bacterioferritin